MKEQNEIFSTGRAFAKVFMVISNHAHAMKSEQRLPILNSADNLIALQAMNCFTSKIRNLYLTLQDPLAVLWKVADKLWYMDVGFGDMALQTLDSLLVAINGNF